MIYTYIIYIYHISSDSAVFCVVHKQSMFACMYVDDLQRLTHSDGHLFLNVIAWDGLYLETHHWRSLCCLCVAF